MKSGLITFFRLAYRTYFDSQGTAARLTLKRFFIMSLFLPMFLVVQLFHFIGLALDNIFFRGFHKVQVKEPLFIVGVPRSGTTYLHGVMAKDTERTTTFRLWELVLAPAIIEKKFWIGLSKLDRRLGSPLKRLISSLERLVTNRAGNIHTISLKAPEEDFLLLLPIFACFLLVLPFPFDDIWRLAYFDDQMPDEDKKRVMSFYKSCLKRHLYVWGTHKQLLSKNASFVPFIDSLRKTFPDCRIVSTVRNPLEVVPSQISAVLPGAQVFDNDTSHHLFRDRFVGILKHYYKQLITRLPELPDRDYLFVHMDDMKENLEDVVVKIYRHFDYRVSDAFLKYLREEAERARRYKSTHHYSLEKFDLDSETVVKNFRFAYDFFDF